MDGLLLTIGNSCTQQGYGAICGTNMLVLSGAADGAVGAIGGTAFGWCRSTAAGLGGVIYRGLGPRLRGGDGKKGLLRLSFLMEG